MSFTLRSSDNQEHPYQAGEVRGVAEGWLMCETRNANKTNRETEEDGESAQRRPRNRRTRPPRGRGPEDGTDEWVLTRRRPGRNPRSNEV